MAVSPKKIMPPILFAPRTPLMPPLPLRHQFPPHSFDSHHLRLAFAPLRACSSHPCFGFEPSALRVRRRSVSSRPQKPGTQNAHAFASHFVSCSWLEPSALALRFSPASAARRTRSRPASGQLADASFPPAARSARPRSLSSFSYPLFRQTLIISQRQQYTVSYGNKVCITDAVLPCGTDKEIL